MRKYLAGAALGTVLAMTPYGLALADTPKDTLVMAFAIDDIISLDPGEAFEISTGEYTGNTYDRLVAFDIKDVSKLRGTLAESWTVSDDGLTYTFKMRKGAKFVSGNPVTAEDAAFSLQRAVILNKSPAFILTQFGLTPETVKEKVKAVDADTLVFQVDKPYAPSFVLNCLTATVASVVDKTEVMKHDKNGDLGNEWLKTNHAGSGAYALRQWKPGESLSLVANENYWGEKPKLKRVLIRQVKESASQQLLLEKGDVDIARNLEADQLKTAKTNANLHLVSAPKGTVWYVGLNQKNQYLQKPEVRKALKYLVDYDGIANVIMAGRATKHQTFLPNGFLGASNDTPYSLDVAKAKDLLKQAGLENGFKATIDTRNVTMTTQIAQSLQSTFAQAGVQLEIIPGDGKQVLTKYRARNHDITMFQWGADYQDPHTNAETFASNPDNSDEGKVKTLAWRNAWDIPDLTKITAANLMERDAAKRAAVYQDLQKTILENSPFIIMFQETEVAVARKNVQNLVLGPSFDTNLYAGISKD